MLKGTTKIELTNVKTGEKEVYQHDNMITNAVNDVLTLNPEFFKSLGAPSTTLFPVVPNLIGGILLCEEPLEEDPEKYWVPSDNPLVGYSSSAVNSTADTKRGSMNLTESGKTDDGKGYRFVFDFTTSQANGTISALGLTSSTAGSKGKGSMYQSNNGLIPINYGYTTVSDVKNSATAADYANARVMTNIVAFDAEKNLAFCVYLSAVNTITVRKIELGITSVGLFNSPTVQMYGKPYEETTLKTSTFGSVRGTSVSSALYSTFLYGEDGYIWGFEHSGNADGNSSGNATVNWIKINMEDLTFTEGTWTIAAQILSFGYHTYINAASYSYISNIRNVTRSVIHGGFLYCVNYTKTGIYKIDLSNPSNVVFLKHPSGSVNVEPIYSTSYSYIYCGTVFNVMYDTVYFANGYIENDEIIETTYTQTATNYPYNYCSPMGLANASKPNLRVGPFLFIFYFFANKSSTGTIYIGQNVYILGNYLATINNLEKPVLKTADKTMKITYILREE